ncbi:hypothetical protein RUM43_006931 [Polyplax serrata]|uniref:Uncharacterized protein n=1 Tax=Polyplax serrata TaxID=468196 RepID=A0AAN8P163_POLSC
MDTERREEDIIFTFGLLREHQWKDENKRKKMNGTDAARWARKENAALRHTTVTKRADKPTTRYLRYVMMSPTITRAHLQIVGNNRLSILEDIFVDRYICDVDDDDDDVTSREVKEFEFGSFYNPIINTSNKENNVSFIYYEKLYL